MCLLLRCARMMDSMLRTFLNQLRLNRSLRDIGRLATDEDRQDFQGEKAPEAQGIFWNCLPSNPATFLAPAMSVVIPPLGVRTVSR